MIGSAIGLILGMGIGMACYWFDIPPPAPPKLAGALLVIAMTAGFVATDLLIGGWVSPS